MRALVIVLFGIAVALAAQPTGSADARRALDLCHQADDAPASAKRDLLDRSLALAEAATAADERDAVAHFAVFCAVGRQTEMAGPTFGSLGALRRMRREVDRALELAPDYQAALTGKGALLVATPRVLGGDPKAAEPLLRHALEIEPDDFRARLTLARALEVEGRRDDARREGARALATAERKHDQDDVASARKLLDDLGAPPTTAGER